MRCPALDRSPGALDDSPATADRSATPSASGEDAAWTRRTGFSLSSQARRCSCSPTGRGCGGTSPCARRTAREAEEALEPLNQTYTWIGGAIGFHATYHLEQGAEVRATATFLPRQSPLYLPVARLLRGPDRLQLTVSLGRPLDESEVEALEGRLLLAPSSLTVEPVTLYAARPRDRRGSSRRALADVARRTFDGRGGQGGAGSNRKG